MGKASETYSVAVDIWSLGALVASLLCNGLPEYVKGWEKDAVAWIHAIQRRVILKWEEQDDDLLWLLIDNMLVESPEERSSADYVHDEAERILRGIANESDDDDKKGSATPKASILSVQSAGESEGAEEASTFHLDIQSASNGSRTPVRETLEGLDGSLIENGNTATPARSEGGWGKSGASDVRNQLIQAPEASQSLPQGSIVDGLLWDSEDPEPANRTSNHGSKATEFSTGTHEVEDDVSLLVRYRLGDDFQVDGARQAVEAFGGRQSIRKRSFPEQSSSVSLPRSFTHPLSANQQRAISKGPPDPKRNKRDE